MYIGFQTRGRGRLAEMVRQACAAPEEQQGRYIIERPGKPNLEILARVGTDQTVFASTNLFLFLSSMALMEGGDPKKALEEKYVTAVKKNWMVWPGVQFVNFKYVPLEHRVLVVNFVSLGSCGSPLNSCLRMV